MFVTGALEHLNGRTIIFKNHQRPEIMPVDVKELEINASTAGEERKIKVLTSDQMNQLKEELRAELREELKELIKEEVMEACVRKVLKILKQEQQR